MTEIEMVEVVRKHAIRTASESRRHCDNITVRMNPSGLGCIEVILTLNTPTGPFYAVEAIDRAEIEKCNGRLVASYLKFATTLMVGDLLRMLHGEEPLRVKQEESS